jgi:uncharacterized protein (TIGR02284 family)
VFAAWHGISQVSAKQHPMEDLSRTIDALTSMIEINNRRASAYTSLAEKTQRNEVKSVFRHFADQARQFASNLSTWRAAYGGFAVSQKKSSAGTWAQVRHLLGLNSGKNIITECEELEREAIKMYKATIAMAFMPPATTADMQTQVREFEKSLSKLRSIKDQTAVGGVLVARA